MPFLSYATPERALIPRAPADGEGGAAMVKLEGADPCRIDPRAGRARRAGSRTGLTPQSVMKRAASACRVVKKPAGWLRADAGRAGGRRGDARARMRAARAGGRGHPFARHSRDRSVPASVAMAVLVMHDLLACAARIAPALRQGFLAGTDSIEGAFCLPPAVREVTASRRRNTGSTEIRGSPPPCRPSNTSARCAKPSPPRQAGQRIAFVPTRQPARRPPLADRAGAPAGGRGRQRFRQSHPVRPQQDFARYLRTRARTKPGLMRRAATRCSVRRWRMYPSVPSCVAVRVRPHRGTDGAARPDTSTAWPPWSCACSTWCSPTRRVRLKDFQQLRDRAPVRDSRCRSRSSPRRSRAIPTAWRSAPATATSALRAPARRRSIAPCSQCARPGAPAHRSSASKPTPCGTL